MCVWIILNNFIVKFGPATLVSMALGETPVVLKGPRHVALFAAALVLVQLSPSELATRGTGLPSASAQLLLALSVSLYKLRKACFVVHAAHAHGHSVWFSTIVTWLVIDGTSAARRVTNVFTAGADGAALHLSARGCVKELYAIIRGTERALRPNLALLLALLGAHRFCEGAALHPASALAVPASGWRPARAAHAELLVRAAALAFLALKYGTHTKARAALDAIQRALVEEPAAAPDAAGHIVSRGATNGPDAVAAMAMGRPAGDAYPVNESTPADGRPRLSRSDSSVDITRPPDVETESPPGLRKTDHQRRGTCGDVD